MITAAGTRPTARPAVAGTPLVDVSLLVRGIERRLRLKLESHNPCGSLKDRIAASLLDHSATAVGREGAGVIESTSGNLGLAMAVECARRGLPFEAVVDPCVSPYLVRRMREAGARVTFVHEPDHTGGYLLSRIRYVRRQMLVRPGLVWTDQYRSAANPAAHQRHTAPELHAQLGARAALLIPVSTGGTLSGVTRYAAEHALDWRLVGVDVRGSVALGGPGGPRPLPGLGSSRLSAFLDPDATAVLDVELAEAVSACLWLRQRAGLGLGGSSGACVAAALRMFRQDPAVTELSCLCPDGAERYQSTVYQPAWRTAHGLAGALSVGAEVLAVRRTAESPLSMV